MSWSARDGVAGAALLAMYADAVISGDEDDDLRDLLLDHPLFDGMGEREVGDMLSRLEAASRKLGTKRLLAELCEAIPPEAREDAYLIAADIIAADEDVAPEENGYLADLARGLGLAPAQIEALLAEVR